ncbi:MAG: CDP-glucose 4,6-dehydratase [bacterium]|nr:CDP-glucose 4,6-dehydratase [bacterium]
MRRTGSIPRCVSWSPNGKFRRTSIVVSGSRWTRCATGICWRACGSRSRRRGRPGTEALNRSFWNGKRVLVTGHTGFKGSWLSLWLAGAGAEITGYALEPPTDPSLFGVARVAESMRSIEADVRDLDRLSKEFAEQRPQIVIHMAAQSLVRRSYREPVETYATNVMGTVHLLEAARRCPETRAVVVVTSDKCYDNREWVWGYRENEPMGGHDPYSSSKGCTELVVDAYRRSYFAASGNSEEAAVVASVRAGNVVGGGDWAEDRLVPDMIRAFAEGRPVVIRSPHSIRPWQHVLEPLHGYLMLAEKLWEDGETHAEGWNFGPRDEDALPVCEVVERLAALWGGGARWELDADEHPPEANYLKLDSSKACRRLGWQPRLDLARTLEWVVEWYRAYHDGCDVRDLSVSQIERYESLE